MSSEFKQIHKPEEYTGPTELVHLHNHSVFSRLDGVATPAQYAEECAARGYPAMSITEHGNIASVPDMYIEFKKHKVKFIPGCEIYYNEDHSQLVARKRDEAFKKQCSARYFNASEDIADHRLYLRLWRSRHLTVLAKNQIGFTNLVKLTTEVHRQGHHSQRGRSRADFELLKKYKEGLIILSGCFNGPVSHALKQRDALRITERHNGKERNRIVESGELLGRTTVESHGVKGESNVDRAVQILRKFKREFGEDYYVELQMPVIKETDPDSIFTRDYDGLLDLLPFRKSIELADDLGIKYAVANDVHYMKREHHRLQRLMMAIDQGVEVNSPDLFASNSSEQYMKTRAELWATFMNYPYHVGLGQDVFERMCDNTLEIADKCQNMKPDTSPKTPIWKGSSDDQLRNDVYTRLKELGWWDEPRKFEIDGKSVTYREQADIELDRFISKGFSSYFLITAQLVRFGRSKGYPFAPRGSAGGSLVCMLLGIHSVNPMLWGLSFDRFMSPSRGGYLLNLDMGDPIN